MFENKTTEVGISRYLTIVYYRMFILSFAKYRKRALHKKRTIIIENPSAIDRMSPKHQPVEMGNGEICLHSMHYKNHEEERKEDHRHRPLINAWQSTSKTLLHKYHAWFAQSNSVSWNALFGFNFDWRMLSRSPTSSACFNTWRECKSESVLVVVDSLTSSSISLVCDAERQKRTRPRTKGVAGKPTVTTETPRFNISRLKALINESIMPSIKGKNRVGLRNLRRTIQQCWHNRWMRMTVDDEAHLGEPLSKVSCIPRELIDSLSS